MLQPSIASYYGRNKLSNIMGQSRVNRTQAENFRSLKMSVLGVKAMSGLPVLIKMTGV